MLDIVVTTALVVILAAVGISGAFVGLAYLLWYMAERRALAPEGQAPQQAVPEAAATAVQPPRPQRRPLTTPLVLAMTREYGAGAVCTIAQAACVKQRDIRAMTVPPDEDDPLMFVHGYLENRGVFLLLSMHLEHGFDFHYQDMINLTPPLVSIPHHAESLMKRLEDAAINMRRERFQLIVHSMGGLVTRYALAFLGGQARISRVVSLGTPHYGTTISVLSRTALGRSMRPGSEVLKALQEREAQEPGCRVPWLAVATRHDEIVTPYESALWEHATANLVVEGTGHIGLLTNAGLADVLGGALTMPVWHRTHLENLILPETCYWEFSENSHAPSPANRT